MYNNIGRKIKALAKVLALVGVILCVLGGIGTIILGILSNNSMTIIISIIGGLATALIGSLIVWIESWLLFGFGEIIDKLTDIEANTRRR